MVPRKLPSWILSVLGAILAVSPARPQAPVGAVAGDRAPFGELRNIEKQDWHVFGRVTSLDGEPIAGAKVRADVGGGTSSVKMLDTDLQGNFRTDFSLDAQQYSRLSVKLTVIKPGYLDAHESVDFGSSDKTWEIDLMMRSRTGDPDQLSAESLVAALAPRLRTSARGLASGSARKDYERGVAEFLDGQEPLRAAQTLNKVVQRQPDCLDCRTLLGLAWLEAGSLTSAERQFGEAAKLDASAQTQARRPEPLIILGVLESWRRQDKKAAGFFTEALKIAPDDPLALQELGRAAIFQQSWEAADDILGQAIKAGASSEARLMRARALLEEGDADAASADMKVYLNGREPKELPLAARTLYTELGDRLQLLEYGKVKSVVSQPLADLEHAMPELRGIAPASSQDALPAILQHVGADVQAFFSQFPNTISVEQTHQEKLGRNGKVADSLDQKFHYLLLAHPEKWGLGLEEYRADEKGARTALTGLQGGFMLTAGFASASLLFHPAYQSGATFRYLGRQTIDGRETDVVAFAQKPDKAKIMGRFNTDEATVLTLTQGLAWIDPANYQIVRMRTDLLKAASKVRLERQTTEIHFDQVRFKEIPSPLWLPREVVVTVQWKGKTFRNLHEYSNFKLFNVETQEKHKTAALFSGSPRA
ncbi:MAG TPA: tetratricopeptide repeat protein [Terriglobia bacterium]|nr:tetratricopeptide repeat protein [Terriglobia bacterium]